MKTIRSRSSGNYKKKIGPLSTSCFHAAYTYSCLYSLCSISMHGREYRFYFIIIINNRCSSPSSSVFLVQWRSECNIVYSLSSFFIVQILWYDSTAKTNGYIQNNRSTIYWVRLLSIWRCIFNLKNILYTTHYTLKYCTYHYAMIMPT